MKRLNKQLCLIFLFTACFKFFGQMGQYDYQRELLGISQPWHKVILPDDMFGKISQDLSDVRIFGLTKDNDTIQAPYLLEDTSNQFNVNEIQFKLLNTSLHSTGYYFTFEIPSEEVMNQMILDFENENFDWHLTLQGSQDQQEWFTVMEDYRVMSINNDQTNFKFTTLNFPDSKYRFFRVHIHTNQKPDLKSARLIKNEKITGTLKTYAIKKMEVEQDKINKQTLLDVELLMPVRMSSIKINVKDTFDFYRPLKIEYLADSIQTQNGWKNQYNILTRGTLASVKDNTFPFESTTVKKFRVIIDNNNNHPLTIEDIEVKGFLYQLKARFVEPAKYYLTYGNKRALKADYDISRFSSQIPDSLIVLDLGIEEKIEKKGLHQKEPLFKSKFWLWGIMILIILILGFFSVRMLKK